MPLQIRRGTNTQRAGTTFAEGEIVYTIDTKKLYVGDGSTTGGIAIDSSLNFPTQSGQNGKFLKTDGTSVSWATVDALPTQSGSNGKFLKTDGTTASWATVDAFPTQSGQTGKFLKTDGTSVSWDSVAVFPTQVGNNNKFLTTDGNTVRWAVVDPYPTQTGNEGKVLITNGSTVNWGSAFPNQTNFNGRFLTTNGTNVSWGAPAVHDDPTPTLGANLNINSFHIQGNGTIDIDGDVIANNVQVAADITTTGDISITGDMTLTGQYSSVNSQYITTPNILSNAGLLVLTKTSNSLTVAGDVTNGLCPSITVVGLRGDYDTPVNTNPNDLIGGLTFKGFYNGDYKASTGIVTAWAGDADLSKAYPRSNLYFTIGNNTDTQSTPTATLSGTGTFTTTTVSVGDGDATHPSLVFSTDGGQDSGFFHPQDGVVCISTNAVERVRVDSGGMRVEGFMKVKDLGVGALPSPAEAGMIVLQNGTFQGYNGSAWVTLG